MQIAYGHGHKTLQLPENTVIAHGKELPPLFDPQFAVNYALGFPVGCKPLAGQVNPRSKVAVLVSDSTRPTGAEVFLPVLMRELDLAGVPDENITILVATGAHGSMHDEDLQKVVPAAIGQRYRVVSHDCFDQSSLVKVGITSRGNEVWFNKLAVEADMRVLTGSVSIHPFAGFGGGRKALFPGVAGYDTISRNHSLLFHENAKPGILQGNPVHEDFMEGIAMVGPKFLLNTVLNEAGEIAAVFGGDVEQAHAAGVRAIEFSSGATVPQLADTVVASAGGYPYDINLYQVVKAVQNAARILKPGGKIVMFAECEEGVGSGKFEQWAKQRLSSKELAAQLSQKFELGKHKCFFVSEILEKAGMYLCSNLPDDLVKSFGLKPFHDPDEVAVEGNVVLLPRATATLPKVGQ